MKYIELNKFLQKHKIYDKQGYKYLLENTLYSYNIFTWWKHIFLWNMIIKKENDNSYIIWNKKNIKTITKTISDRKILDHYTWKYFTYLK